MHGLHGDGDVEPEGGDEVEDIRDAAVRSVAKRFSDSEFSLRFFANVVGLAHDIQDAKRGQPKSD